MKKIYVIGAGFIAALLVVGGVYFSAMNDEQVFATRGQHPIIGKWVSDSNPDSFWVFTDDGAFGRQSLSRHTVGNTVGVYSIYGDILLLNGLYVTSNQRNSGYPIRTYSIVGNTLTLSWQRSLNDLRSSTYTRSQ